MLHVAAVYERYRLLNRAFVWHARTSCHDQSSWKLRGMAVFTCNCRFVQADVSVIRNSEVVRYSGAAICITERPSLHPATCFTEEMLYMTQCLCHISCDHEELTDLPEVLRCMSA